jgi:hypothetical protein
MADLLTRSFYSLELGQRVIVRGLHFDEMRGLSDVLDRMGRNTKQANMAVMCQTIRFGMVDPHLESETHAVEFASQNTKAAWRAFELIRELTTDE